MLFCWGCRPGQARTPCSCTKCLQLQKWKLKGKHQEWRTTGVISVLLQNCTFYGKNRCKTSCLTLKSTWSIRKCFHFSVHEKWPSWCVWKANVALQWPAQSWLHSIPQRRQRWTLALQKEGQYNLPWRTGLERYLCCCCYGEWGVSVCLETLYRKCVITSHAPFCRQGAEIGPCSHWAAETTFTLSYHKELWSCLHDFMKLVLEYVIVPERGLPHWIGNIRHRCLVCLSFCDLTCNNLPFLNVKLCSRAKPSNQWLYLVSPIVCIPGPFRRSTPCNQVGNWPENKRSIPVFIPLGKGHAAWQFY